MDDKNQVFSLQDVMGDRFARYAKYIIQERALPDVRDGLKPVQRRILYSMYFEGNIFGKPHRKSAKTVGNVIGNYHPHGDSSVYEAMVRMSQWWKVREPLVDMHGNNGSIDNDPAAAMRYTEARLSLIAGELLKDIEKGTVSMTPNFDDTTVEPTVLPARFPALLVNGAKGIAAGYATDIPPHNLNEVIEATIHRLKNPNCLLSEVMNFIKGPDFPTGGIVQGIDGIIEAFTTGRGKCVVKAKTKITEYKNYNQIIVSEIPYEVIKSDLVRSIDQIYFDKKIDGIIEVRDESDKEGLRIAIDLNKEMDPELILNYLLKNTSLQVNYNYNVVAISNNRPMQMGVLSILDAYIAHQVDVNTKRANFDLSKAENRLHIIKGLVVAIENLDEVIKLIRSSKDKGECKRRLIERFMITEKQAEAVVSLQLYRLSSTDINMLNNEKGELETLCFELTSLLNDEKLMKKLITSELKEISKKYVSPRRSVIEDEIDEIVVDRIDMIIKEEVMVSVSKKGYCKRSSIKSFNLTEVDLPNIKEDDILIGAIKADTTDILLMFTTKGNYLYIPVFELSEIKWRDEGDHINNIVTLASEEYIVSVILVKDFKDHVNIVIASKNGVIKKTKLPEFIVQRYTRPCRCMRLNKNDEVVGVDYSDGKSEVVVLTHKGNALRYHEENVSAIGIRAGGVKAVNDIKKDGNLVGMVVLREHYDKNVFLLTDNGGVKVINPKNINLTNRTNKSTSLFKCFKSDPHDAIFLAHVNEDKVASALVDDSSVVKLDLSERPQPFEKNIKNILNIADGTKLIAGSSLVIDVIDENTQAYDEKLLEFKQKNEKEEKEDKPVVKSKSESNYEKISILDLLDEDF